MSRPAPGWYPDPMTRFELRYHNGEAWTADVSSDGRRYVDPQGIRPSVDAPSDVSGRQPADARNPSATAAMTLGIIAVGIGWLPVVAVLGAIAAVLAIVLGVIGRRRSRRTGVGRGAALTGLITGGAGIAMSVVGVIFTISIFAAVDRFSDPADNDTSILSCTRDEDDVTARGELTNLDDRAAGFTVRVFFVRPGTDNPRRAALVDVGRVEPGATVPFEITRAVGPDPVDCIVGAVRGPLPYGIDPGR